MTVRLTRGVEIAQLAKTAGFDMLYVDLEHSTFSLDTTGQICLAALSAGIAPMVRVPANTPEYIQRVLDGGALGIIAPGIGSAEEAREVVKAAKFPPLGERGAGGALPHLQYRSFPAAEANAAVNDATMVIVQFESADAVEHADEIAAVEGVDMVLIGVNDMLASMGLAGQYEHPKVREAYARTIAACRKHGKHVGVGGLSTPAEAGGGIRRHGRAHGVDRHRHSVSARRHDREGEASARDPGVMTKPTSNPFLASRIRRLISRCRATPATATCMFSGRPAVSVFRQRRYTPGDASIDDLRRCIAPCISIAW